MLSKGKLTKWPISFYRDVKVENPSLITSSSVDLSMRETIEGRIIVRT